MSDLAKRHCAPCQGGTPPLSADARVELGKGLHSDWRVVEGHHLERTFRFPDFRQALALPNRGGELAEAEGHHPDLCVGWGKVTMQVWTHKINGLSDNDFILAAKADEVEKPAGSPAKG